MMSPELERYFTLIERRVPDWAADFLRWLRKPSSFVPRLLLAILLIAGGLLSFLPILGLWMLPLGLILIAQDIPWLDRPLVRGLGWIEAKWKQRR